MQTFTVETPYSRCRIELKPSDQTMAGAWRIDIDRLLERQDAPGYFVIDEPTWDVTMRNRIKNACTGKPTRTELVSTHQTCGEIGAAKQSAERLFHLLHDGRHVSEWPGQLIKK